MKLIVIVLSVLLVLAPNSAHADWVSKHAALTCDPDQNIAIIRLDILENTDDLSVVRGPKLTGNFQEKYGHLVTYNEPILSECTLSDGRRLFVTDNTGQAYAYGEGGGDPDAFFSFLIDQKPIYYKARWYAGRAEGAVKRSIIILDGSNLTSCKGPDGYKQGRISEFEIKEADCIDESNRLEANLTGEELGAYNLDRAREEYKVINSDDKLCSYFQDKKNIKESTWGNRDSGFEFFKRDSLSKEVSFGLISKIVRDITNDGKIETVYRIHGYAGYFDGSYFIFFDDKEDEVDFVNCILSGKCTNKLSPENYKQNVEYIVDNAPSIWPSAHVISSGSLNPSIGSEYNVRYTWVYPVSFEDKTYFYFKPVNNEKMPRAVVAKLKPDYKFEEICTYKD